MNFANINTCLPWYLYIHRAVVIMIWISFDAFFLCLCCVACCIAVMLICQLHFLHRSTSPFRMIPCYIQHAEWFATVHVSHHILYADVSRFIHDIKVPLNASHRGDKKQRWPMPFHISALFSERSAAF